MLAKGVWLLGLELRYNIPTICWAVFPDFITKLMITWAACVIMVDSSVSKGEVPPLREIMLLGHS